MAPKMPASSTRAPMTMPKRVKKAASLCSSRGFFIGAFSVRRDYLVELALDRGRGPWVPWSPRIHGVPCDSALVTGTFTAKLGTPHGAGRLNFEGPRFFGQGRNFNGQQASPGERKR